MPRVVQFAAGAPTGALEVLPLTNEGHVVTNARFRDGQFSGTGGWRGWADLPK